MPAATKPVLPTLNLTKVKLDAQAQELWCAST